MEYEFDEMMGFDMLGLYYEAHMAGFDGECFTYSIYFEDDITDEKFDEVNKTINDYAARLDDQDIYPGYIDIQKKPEKVYIYHDLGNVEDCNMPVHGILKALNAVPGIKSVILND